MPEHNTITKLGPQSWQCSECGKLGSFGELVRATDCTSTVPLRIGMVDCPGCNGNDDECEDCGGLGTVTVRTAKNITKPQKL